MIYSCVMGMAIITPKVEEVEEAAEEAAEPAAEVNSSVIDVPVVEEEADFVRIGSWFPLIVVALIDMAIDVVCHCSSYLFVYL